VPGGVHGLKARPLQAFSEAPQRKGPPIRVGFARKPAGIAICQCQGQEGLQIRPGAGSTRFHQSLGVLR